MGYGQLPSFKDMAKDSVYTFYTHIDQKIEIKLNNADASKIDIKLSDGYVTKINDSLYQVRYSINFDEAKIRLYYKKFPVDIMTVKAANMTIADIKLGDAVNKILKKTDLLAINKIELIYPTEMPMSLRPELFSYKLVIYQPGMAEPFFTNMRTLELPQNIQKMIAALPIDSKISFEEIRIKTITNNVLNLENDAIVYTIVE